MKNAMKKVFSLLLVGVVAASMFGFTIPNFKGTVVLSNPYNNHQVLTFYVSFTDNDGNVTDIRPCTLTHDYMRFVPIPFETKFVNIRVSDGVHESNTRLKVLFEGASRNEISVSSYKITYEKDCWLKVAN